MFYVIPDKPPKITISKPPERTRRGALKLTYTIEDDYGVVSAEAKVKKIKPRDDKAADPAKDLGPRRHATERAAPAARAPARDRAAPAARLLARRRRPTSTSPRIPMPAKRSS